MKEISEFQHNQVLVNSLNKMLTAFKLGVDADITDLQILNIIYDLQYSSCMMLPLDDYYRLNKIYYRIIRNNNLICTPDLSNLLYKSNSNFKFYRAHVDDAPIPPESRGIYYSQNNKTIIEILDNLENLMQGVKIESLDNVTVDFDITNLGRFTLVSDIDIRNYKIYDILNNDITSEFALHKREDLYVIVSNNIITGSILKLKFIKNE